MKYSGMMEIGGIKEAIYNARHTLDNFLLYFPINIVNCVLVDAAARLALPAHLAP